MNYCTKCASIYATPGTCNCFAPAKTLPYLPWVPPPTPWPQPWTPPPFVGPSWIAYPNTTTRFEITGGTQTGGVTTKNAAGNWPTSYGV